MTLLRLVGLGWGMENHGGRLKHVLRLPTGQYEFEEETSLAINIISLFIILITC